MISLKKIDRYKKRFNESNFKKKTMPKILSVLFAIIFWFYVMDQVNPEMVRTIPNLGVEILNQESIQSGGYVILNEKVPTVTVKIKGRRKAVMNIKPEDIILSADVKDFHKGNNYFPINKKIFADNVVIEDLSENRVQMNIDRLMEAAQKVTLKTVGQLPEGESLGDVKLSPETVVVRGPESYVKQVASVVGDLDLANVQNNAVANVALKAVNRQGQTIEEVSLSSSSISATIGVLRENNAEIEANLVGSLPNGYKVTQIEVTPKMVALKGQAGSEVQALKVVQTKPIDLSNLTESQTFDVGLSVPSDANLQGAPDTVRVALTIEKIEEKTLTYKASDIQWFNLPKDITVSLPDPERSLTVRVKAVTSVLDQLDAADLQLEVDGGELIEGVNKVKVTASGSLQTESMTVLPATIEVEGVKR